MQQKIITEPIAQQIDSHIEIADDYFWNWKEYYNGEWKRMCLFAKKKIQFIHAIAVHNAHRHQHWALVVRHGVYYGSFNFEQLNNELNRLSWSQLIFDYIGSVFKCFLFASFQRNSSFFLRKTPVIAWVWLNSPEICSEWSWFVWQTGNNFFFLSLLLPCSQRHI